MTVRYHQRAEGLRQTYACQRERVDRGAPVCEIIPGAAIDEAVGDVLVAMMTPVALEVALTVQRELVARSGEADKMRKQQVERARYEADLARRRYMQVDPDNRLVADSLEAEWNECLRALSAAQEDYARKSVADAMVVDEQQRTRVLALAADFPKLWRDPKTSMRDRKRMVRLLIDDVTITRDGAIRVQVRFRGGTTRSLALPLPKRAWELRQTPPDVVRDVDAMLE